MQFRTRHRNSPAIQIAQSPKWSQLAAYTLRTANPPPKSRLTQRVMLSARSGDRQVNKAQRKARPPSMGYTGSKLYIP